jgi:hypothetical protein
VSFASYAALHGASWNLKTWTRCAAHNLARPGGLRRPLKIPNPVSYFALAGIVANNWFGLYQHTWQQRFSASRLYVSKSVPRAIVPRYRYRELPRLRALRRRATRYLLRADINQFYPTLYTHTIPWALHTKQACKAALTAGKGKPSLGDQIDRALQCMNEGQTHGIPIGPDVCLVAAEVLLAAVDKELLNRCKSLVRGFRYVDDYELSFNILSDAEKVLMELQSIMADYELTLNPRKTRIDELPKAIESNWGAELSRFAIRDSSSPAGQRNDVVALFSRAYEIASLYPEDSVLKYAVSRVQNLDVNSAAWHAFHNCVLGAASADPSTIAVSLGTLHQTAAIGKHSVFKNPLAETFESVIARHAPRGEGSEVAWALWGALAWSVPLGATAAQLVGKMDDSIVALLALDADARKLFPVGALDKQRWAAAVAQSNVLNSEDWLLAYEANQQKWLPCPALAADPIYSKMSTAGVSFYDRSRNAPQFPPAALGFPGGTLADDYA